MQNTPQRSTRDNSAFMEPIFFETPRIKRFYEINSDLSDERFHNKSHMIFTLMESPADPFSLAKKNLIMLRGSDFFSETPDLSSLADDILDRNDHMLHTSKYTESSKPLYSREAEHETYRHTKTEAPMLIQHYSDVNRTIGMDEYQHDEQNQINTLTSQSQTYNNNVKAARVKDEYQSQDFHESKSGKLTSNLSSVYADIMRTNETQDNYKQDYPAPVRKHSSSHSITHLEKNVEDGHRQKRQYFTPVQKETAANKQKYQKDSGEEELDTNLDEYLVLAQKFSAVNRVGNNKENEKDDELHKIKYLTPVQKNTNSTKINCEKECEHEHDQSTTVGSQLKSGGTSSEHEEPEKFSRYDKQVIKFGLSAREGEIRKRKRKSAAQLKQLKVEFDFDDNWDKERITKISETTGLSESQVYKWCWDQRKKIDSDHPGSMKEMMFEEDKENIYPKSGSSLNNQSKIISKNKSKPRSFRLVKGKQEIKIMSPTYYSKIEGCYNE